MLDDYKFLDKRKGDYLIKCDGRLIASLLRQKDGTLSIDKLYPIVRLGLSEGEAIPHTVTLTLEDDNGYIIYSDVIKQWDADNVVTIYQRFGPKKQAKLLCINDKRPVKGKVFCMFTFEEYAVSPKPLASASLGDGYVVHYFSKNWGGEVKVMFEDSVMWSSVASGRRKLYTK